MVLLRLPRSAIPDGPSKSAKSFVSKKLTRNLTAIETNEKEKTLYKVMYMRKSLLK
jgi:hypothetical protein